ncbi:hypothetical protein [uncultured Chitinophaga sp.]|uniref:hypothetical protein n=1 Tax=uncultured Chitinophaga sp. TaxID=339340 RepID=UPI0025FD7488|nr:hypothetical protein [uncultured Chitinophaga sp.]
MTDKAYKALKKALQERLRLVKSSPAEASRVIDELGIRHLLVKKTDEVRQPIVRKSQKAISKKTASKKAAR